MKLKDITVRLREFTRDELPEADRQLVERAVAMTARAYAPYSRFGVGAAIRLANGVIVEGSNQENAAFPSGTCAERTACFYAGAHYPGVAFDTIAIAARESDGRLTAAPISPCGGCRQALLEYEKIGGNSVRLLLVGRESVYEVPSVRGLLPLAFTQF